MIKTNTRRKKGGVWKKVIQTAIVPLVLLAIRNSLTRKSKHGFRIPKKRK
jgi:hypothetical protein